jgi:hypothetical protein
MRARVGGAAVAGLLVIGCDIVVPFVAHAAVRVTGLDHT